MCLVSTPDGQALISLVTIVLGYPESAKIAKNPYYSLKDALPIVGEQCFTVCEMTA